MATGRQVVIAADGRPLALLKAEFPNVETTPLPGYDIRHPDSGPMAAAMARQLPKIARGIIREHRWLRRFAKNRPLSLIISDNRFGLWHPRLPCVYLTHQLRIKLPPAWTRHETLLRRLHEWVVSRYTECWVPDFAGEANLSSDLSHGSSLPGNVRYVGVLSRFALGRSNPPLPPPSIEGEEATPHDIIAMLSGPEPQRSIFEELILMQLSTTELRALVVGGRTEEYEDEWITDRVRVVSRMTSRELEEAFRGAAVVLARPGYSTLMDLAVLGKPAILVPTPGQTEQEYLAGRLASSGAYVVMTQPKFDLARAWREVQGRPGLTLPAGPGESFIPRLEALLQEGAAS